MTMFTRYQVKGGARRLILGVLVVTAIAGLLSVTAARLTPDQDELAIQETIRKGIVAEQTLAVPPGTYKGGMMSDTIQGQMLRRVPSTLRNYYGAGALGRLTSALQDNIRKAKDGKQRYLDGGVESLVFAQILVTGDTAVATAQAEVWAKVAQDQDGKLVTATPRAPVDYTFVLAKINGRWIINSEERNFSPGTGP